MADTLNYFIAGYLVIFVLLGIYVAWLAVLNRRIKRRVSERGQETAASE
ncbi:MAG: hypothetical protein GX603_08385 [Chloroflexi bacterium]|nr:hypothetical protein [Chloroflexota bacterium]